MSRAPFAPHAAKPTYRMLRVSMPPVVSISADALARMSCYVGLSQDEVGWMGTVAFIPGTGAGQDRYHVDSVYMLAQGAHATTTEIDPQAISDLAFQMIQEDGTTDRAESLLLWGHSHVNMDTAPSHQDDAQMQEFAEGGAPFMLRLIANKRGRVVIDVYDYATGMAWLDVRWTTDVDPVAERIQAELTAKVRRIPPVVSAGVTTLVTPGVVTIVKTPPSSTGGRLLLDAYQHIVLSSGLRPTTQAQWDDAFPIRENYTDMHAYVADYKTWSDQIQAWHALRDAAWGPGAGAVLMASGIAPSTQAEWNSCYPAPADYPETVARLAAEDAWHKAHDAWHVQRVLALS